MTKTGYDFYEVPQAATRQQNDVSADGLDVVECPGSGTQEAPDGHNVLPEDTEINKINIINNSGINNTMNESAGEIQKPKVKEITIPRPIATGKARPKPIDQPKQAVFDF